MYHSLHELIKFNMFYSTFRMEWFIMYNVFFLVWYKLYGGYIKALWDFFFNKLGNTKAYQTSQTMTKHFIAKHDSYSEIMVTLSTNTCNLFTVYFPHFSSHNTEMKFGFFLSRSKSLHLYLMPF